MFAENIRWVGGSWDVEVCQDPSCDGFSDAMKCQCVVALVEPRVRDSAAFDNGLIVTKHERSVSQWGTEVS